MIRELKVTKIVAHILLILMSIVTLVPIVWMVMSSLKEFRWEIYGEKPVFIFTPVIKHYINAFLSPYDLWINLSNSVIISTGATVLSVLLGLLGAYAFARYDFRAKENLAFFVLSIRFLPDISVVIPMYLIFNALRLVDTHFGLIILYTLFNLPFCVWVIRSFLEEVPEEIEEAMLLDGESRLGVIRRITMPLAAPGIAATALLTFIFCWNEYTMAMFLSKTATQTMTMFMTQMRITLGIEWEILFTASTVHIIPVLLAAAFLQRYIVRGLTLGAVTE